MVDKKKLIKRIMIGIQNLNLTLKVRYYITGDNLNVSKNLSDF